MTNTVLFSFSQCWNDDAYDGDDGDAYVYTYHAFSSFFSTKIVEEKRMRNSPPFEEEQNQMTKETFENRKITLKKRLRKRLRKMRKVKEKRTVEMQKVPGC